MSDEADVAGPRTGASRSRLDTPFFRAVTTSRGRKALRLEASFWTSLDLICRERKITRNALIEEITDALAPEQGNLSSHVRSYVARYLLDRYDLLSEQTAPQFLIALMQQAPLPSYAMSRDRKLLKVNREFLRLLQLVSGSPNTAISLETIQLSIETPLAEVIEAIENEDRPHQCGITISVGNRARKTQTRIVGLPGTPVPAVVGYILS